LKVIQDLSNVDNMFDLTNKELKTIVGGINITAAFINGVKGIFSIFFDFGNSLGSSIRRIKEKKLCPIR